MARTLPLRDTGQSRRSGHGRHPTTIADGMRSLPLSLARQIVLGLCLVLAAVIESVNQFVLPRPATALTAITQRLGRFAVTFVMDLRIVFHGRPPPPHRQYMVIANHASWIDIALVYVYAPSEFVAKGEIARWPFIRHVCRAFRAIFIDRDSRFSVPGQVAAMRRRLRAGASVAFFPEGGCGDGNRLLPFKTSLFAAADGGGRNGKPLFVLPVTIAYTALDGLPLGRMFRPFYAFNGKLGFAGHFASVLGLGRTAIHLTFHEPVPAAGFASRKDLAAHCRNIMSASLMGCLRGTCHAQAGGDPS